MKITVINHYVPIRMAKKFKKFDNTNCWWICGEIITHKTYKMYSNDIFRMLNENNLLN